MTVSGLSKGILLAAFLVVSFILLLLRFSESTVLIADWLIERGHYRYAEHLLDRLYVYPIYAADSAAIQIRYAAVREKTGNLNLALVSYHRALLDQDANDEILRAVNQHIAKLELKISQELAPEPGKVLYSISPEYPDFVGFVSPKGDVLVEFDVSADGRVEFPRILEARPPRFFDEAVIRAVRSTVFEPKKVDLIPVPVHNVRRLYSFSNQHNISDQFSEPWSIP